MKSDPRNDLLWDEKENNSYFIVEKTNVNKIFKKEYFHIINCFMEHDKRHDLIVLKRTCYIKVLITSGEVQSSGNPLFPGNDCLMAMTGSLSTWPSAYIYIYIYMCVCVCVRERERERERERVFSWRQIFIKDNRQGLGFEFFISLS